MKTFLAIILSLATSHAVQLIWDPLNHPDVDGYILHYGLNPITLNQHVSIGNVTTAAVEDLPVGNTIYFVCTAHATTGEESGPSNQVAYVVPIPTPVPSNFKVGDRIVLKGNTNVRSSPGIANNLVGMNPLGTMGMLVEGPASGAGAVTWWKVDYDGSAFDGWSGEDNFVLSSAPPPTPTPTPIPTPTPTPPVVVPIMIDDVEGLRATLNSLQEQLNTHQHKVPEVITK
jgi:hypothetical protein